MSEQDASWPTEAYIEHLESQGQDMPAAVMRELLRERRKAEKERFDLLPHLDERVRKDWDAALKAEEEAKAALTAAQARIRELEEVQEAAVLAEREACAKICDLAGHAEQHDYGLVRGTQNYFRAARAIRARSLTKGE